MGLLTARARVPSTGQEVTTQIVVNDAQPEPDFRVGIMLGMGKPDMDAHADAVDATLLRLFQNTASRTAYVARIRQEVAQGRMVIFAGSSFDLNWWQQMADDLEDLAGMVVAGPYHEPGIETFKPGEFPVVGMNNAQAEAEYRRRMHLVIDQIGDQLPMACVISSYADRPPPDGSGRPWVDAALGAALKDTGGAYCVDGYFRNLTNGAYTPGSWGALFDDTVAKAASYDLDVYITETGALTQLDSTVVPESQQVARINAFAPWRAANPRVRGACWWPNDGLPRNYKIHPNRPNSVAAWANLER